MSVVETVYRDGRSVYWDGSEGFWDWQKKFNERMNNRIREEPTVKWNPPKPEKLGKGKGKRSDLGYIEKRMQMYEQGMTDTEIAKVEGRDPHIIYNWRGRNGLQMNERQYKRLKKEA